MDLDILSHTRSSMNDGVAGYYCAGVRHKLDNIEEILNHLIVVGKMEDS